MSDIANISGLKEELWARTQGDPQICVAVLDGLVDQGHPCFEGANLTRLQTLVQGEASPQGTMSQHGTHVTSLIFGQPNSPVQGIAPKCQGLIVPIFSDEQRRLSQLDLARAIELAANAGAQIINISGGQLSDYGEADGWLERAVNLCRDHNILIIAAAGNDSCDCLHVPAALGGVLAVGAMDDQGKPIDYSNWGTAYQTQGILAPGENLLGAKPGGGTMRMSGTSFATPIVSGVAALLLSLQLQRGEEPNPQKVREAILQSALPCEFDETDGEGRCLVGKLNIPGAIKLITGETMSEELETVEASGCGCTSVSEVSDAIASNQAEAEDVNSSATETAASAVETASATSTEIADSGAVATSNPAPTAPVAANPVFAAALTPANQPSMPEPPAMSYNPMNFMPSNASNSVMASQAPSDIKDSNIIYALGTLGYDFGTEARRDSFKQLMPAVDVDGTLVPANPYDARQMADYLGESLSEAKSLIWTLNLELTPIYAIEPRGEFGRDVYAILHELLSGQIQAEDSEDYVERVSIPGILSGRTVKLFSGQVVPVLEPQNTRGLYGWKINTLVNAALDTVRTETEAGDEETMRRTLGSFLNRIYYDFRNLGVTSQDRALNFATTNAFQAASTFAEAVAIGMELDSITVEKSPFCRVDSDCWDVKLKFFDPENNRRARKIFRFTIDVSDLIPVTLGEVRTWSSSY